MRTSAKRGLALLLCLLFLVLLLPISALAAEASEADPTPDAEALLSPDTEPEAESVPEAESTPSPDPTEEPALTPELEAEAESEPEADEEALLTPGEDAASQSPAPEPELALTANAVVPADADEAPAQAEIEYCDSMEAEQAAYARMLADYGMRYQTARGDRKAAADPRFESCRLIVVTDGTLADTTGAVRALHYADEYVLQFETPADAALGYERLLEAGLYREVCPDLLLSVGPETDEGLALSANSLLDGTEPTHISWGVPFMGLDTMETRLQNADYPLPEIIVAVLDGGVTADNPYLAGRLLEGYNAVDGSSDVSPVDSLDHGTHVAGVVADGTPDNVKILPIKVLDPQGLASLLVVKNSIQYALNRGASVINISLSAKDESGATTYLEQSFQNALDQGCVVVVSAGNGGTSADLYYPAHSPLVLTIAALDRQKATCSFSNHGSSVDFSLPGHSINSTCQMGLTVKSGTSMAVPHCAAAAACLKSWRPSLSVSAITGILQAASEDLGDLGRDDIYGYGLIHMDQLSVSRADWYRLNQTELSLTVGESAQLQVTDTEAGQPLGSSAGLVWTSDTPEIASVDGTGVVTALAAGDAMVTVTSAAGDYSEDCAVQVQAPVICTVSFDANGGEGSKDSETVTAGSSYTLPAADTFTPPEGMEFDCWSVQIGQAAAENMEAGAGITVTANVTVTAQWKSAFTPEELSIVVGRSLVPPVADPAGLSWSSSDTEIVTLNGSGRITGVKVGAATVTGRDGDRIEAQYRVQVLFTDVTDPSAFFYQPVYWAVENGITTGTTPTTFAPFSGCTRGQIVTFLWRANGCPEPTVKNPFKDIKSTDFCYKAVLWAYENGITTGTTPATFSPNNVCTREQCVTFLWRAAGEPAAGSSAGFTDVIAGKFYEEAVNWAFANGVTTGITPTKFGVGLTCTRAQIVTFIYRAIA